ncbi:MAG: MxaS protein [Gammaproteobacteria bacterium HGW-Gammaproteobacteria-3]|nr:MAG: MxaS protein [Gammaproteobacteria bacterium HGW-Gammaproteobacteria-3]
MPAPVKTFHYRRVKPVNSIFPGAHPGQMIGSGPLFKHHEPLIANPDPRRLDLRASMLDPFAQYRVRAYQQKSALTIYLVADLSASMAFSGHNAKPQILSDLVNGCAQSAFEYDDKFGFIGCSHPIDTRFLLPACRQPGRTRKLARALLEIPFKSDSKGLEHAAHHLPVKRSLVFLVSDFHFESQRISRIMHGLSRHDVIPLVLWDDSEYRDLPQWGIVKYRDMENATTRTLLMRPALKQSIIAAFRQRRRLLQQCFRAFGAEPLFLNQGYQVEAFNHYFQQRVL